VTVGVWDGVAVSVAVGVGVRVRVGVCVAVGVGEAKTAAMASAEHAPSSMAATTAQARRLPAPRPIALRRKRSRVTLARPSSRHRDSKEPLLILQADFGPGCTGASRGGSLPVWHGLSPARRHGRTRPARAPRAPCLAASTSATSARDRHLLLIVGWAVGDRWSVVGSPWSS